MVFCHLQENLVINMVKQQRILQQKQEWTLQKLRLKKSSSKTEEATGDLLEKK